MTERDFEALDREIERIDAGGETWEDSEPVDVKIKRPLNMVIPVRMASDKWLELHAIARERGIGPSTLVRMWVLERLREESLTKRPAS